MTALVGLAGTHAGALPADGLGLVALAQQADNTQLAHRTAKGRFTILDFVLRTTAKAPSRTRSGMQDIEPNELGLLIRLASKYIWWQTPEEAVSMPERVIAQVMNIGDYRDVQALAEQIGDLRLQEVLKKAEAGQFSPRSWAYWHYRLKAAAFGQVPELPKRSFA